MMRFILNPDDWLARQEGRCLVCHCEGDSERRFWRPGQIYRGFVAKFFYKQRLNPGRTYRISDPRTAVKGALPHLGADCQALAALAFRGTAAVSAAPRRLLRLAGGQRPLGLADMHKRVAMVRSEIIELRKAPS